LCTFPKSKSCLMALLTRALSACSYYDQCFEGTSSQSYYEEKSGQVLPSLTPV
jgi:hypothetical protein